MHTHEPDVVCILTGEVCIWLPVQCLCVQAGRCPGACSTVPTASAPPQPWHGPCCHCYSVQGASPGSQPAVSLLKLEGSSQLTLS